MSPKTVKRYANRKLYDTERSCYVTLEDISGMIKAGEEVRVIDNKTGEDLTTVTLAQIIFETEKKKNFMPLELLRDLIRNRSDTISEFARERVDRVQTAAQDIKDTAKETAQKLRTDLEEKIDRFAHRRPDGSAEGDAAGAHPSDGSGEPQSVHARIAELATASRRSFDELQKSIEERVRGSVGAVSRYAHLDKEVEEIRQRLADLENRIGKS